LFFESEKNKAAKPPQSARYLAQGPAEVKTADA